MAFILHFGPKTSCSYAPLALFCFSFLWATPSSPAISASAAALALSFCIMVWGKTFDFLAYKNSEKKHENISLGKKKKMKAKMRNGNAQEKSRPIDWARREAEAAAKAEDLKCVSWRLPIAVCLGLGPAVNCAKWQRQEQQHQQQQQHQHQQHATSMLSAVGHLIWCGKHNGLQLSATCRSM